MYKNVKKVDMEFDYRGTNDLQEIGSYSLFSCDVIIFQN